MRQRYAPDTNFFLQFKKAQELRWSEITSAETIELVVLSEVLAELDNHKNGGNGRRARRARDIVSALRPLMVEGLKEVVVRDKDPRVVFRLAPVLPAGRAKPEQLDMSKADARIVEETLACSAGEEVGLTLLSHDGFPLRLAEAIGLARQALPDHWRLEPEPDARDKKIRELEQVVGKWESRSPRINIELRCEGIPTSNIERVVDRAPEPAGELLDRLVAEIEARYPEQSTAVPGMVTIFRSSEIERYRRQRREWLDALRRQMIVHAGLYNFRVGMVPIELVFTNTGGATAEHMAVELQAEGDVSLVSMKAFRELEADVTQKWSDPPRLMTFSEIAINEPMHGLDDPIVSRMPSLRGIHGIQGRDFHWEFDEPEYQTARVCGACGDFRHGIHRETLSFGIVVPMNGNDSGKGRLVLTYSAKNLPEPVEITWPVRLQLREGTVEDELETLVNKWLKSADPQ